MSGFAVDLDLLDEPVGGMRAFGSRLEATRDDLDGRVNRLQAVWTGVAATEQVEAHRRWARGAAEMQDALATLSTIATTAHGNYGAAIRANTSMWAR